MLLVNEVISFIIWLLTTYYRGITLYNVIKKGE